MRKHTLFRLIFGMIVAAAFLFWGDRLFYKKARKFDKAIHVGQTRAQILEAAGEPAEQHSKGAELLRWGGTEPHLVTDEAWVYYFGPGHILRISVNFRNGIVDRIHHDRT